MSFMNIDFTDTFEPKSVEPGEYQLRVLRTETKTSQKSGGEYLNVQFEIVDNPEAKDIYKIFMYPTSQDDKKKANSRKTAILNFITACGEEPTPNFDLSVLDGATCFAILGEEDDPEYGLRNTVRKFLPRK